MFGAGKLRGHLNETSDIRVGTWWDWLIKIVVPVGLLFVVIYGGFRHDIVKPYEGYPLWAASIIWVLLIVTLILSFVLQGAKTRMEKGGEPK